MTTEELFNDYSKALKNDPDLAWGWQCNLAVPLMDGGMTHEAANYVAAKIMQNIFDINIQHHKQFKYFKKQWENK